MYVLLPMKLINIFFYITLVKVINGLAEVNTINLFLDVLLNKNIKFAQIFSCFSPKDQIQMMKTFSQNNIRSSFTTRLLHTNLNPLYFILDVSCTSSITLKEYEKLNYFRSHYKWLLFDSTRRIMIDSSNIATVLADVHLRLDSEMLIALQNTNVSEVLLYEVYEAGLNQVRGIIKFGVWTPSTHLLIKNRVSKYNSRKNLTGAFLRCATVHTRPLYNESLDFHYRSLKHKKVDTGNKFSYVLFMNIQEIHNFSYNFTLTDQWFGNMSGGMNAGLGQLLYEGVVDVGATVATIKNDRVKYYDYIFPTYPFRTVFIFRNSRLSGKVQNEFLRPFVSTLWYMVLTAIVLFCVVLKLLFAAGHGVLSENNETWHMALLLTWGVICQQGAFFVPRSLSGKCALVTMLLMSFLVYNYYTSSIVSSLLSGLPPPIKTIDQLANSKLRVGLQDVPYVKTLLAVTNDTSLQRLYKTKILSNNEQPYVSVSYGLKHVQRGGYAYHAEPHISYSVIETNFEPYEICELAEINLYAPAVLWVVSKKHSEYTKMFAIGYSKMLQVGIIKREVSVWMARKPACLGNTHLEAVNFDHILSAFVILSIGWAVALLVLLIEVCAYRIIK